MTTFPVLNGEVEQVDVIVVGHLRWNRYYGETADNPPRGYPSTCTSVLVRGMDAAGQPYALLVDPTWRMTASDYYFDLNRRSGLHQGDITHCFITHHHQDHQVGLGYFPKAFWCTAPGVVALLRDSKDIDGSRVQPAVGEFLPGIAPLHLPGHTETIHGLAVAFQGRRWVIAGDGVMTRQHYQHETTEFQWDGKRAAETIRMLKREADVVIPGHDNLIVNWR